MDPYLVPRPAMPHPAPVLAIALCAAALPLEQSLCSNTCRHSRDLELFGVPTCDDGGPGAHSNECELGSDCADCGPRRAPVCTNVSACCTAVYAASPGDDCAAVPLYDLAAFDCRRAAAALLGSRTSDLPGEHHNCTHSQSAWQVWRRSLCGHASFDTRLPYLPSPSVSLGDPGLVLDLILSESGAKVVSMYRDPMCAHTHLAETPRLFPYVGSEHGDVALTALVPPLPPAPPHPPPHPPSPLAPPAAVLLLSYAEFDE